MKIKAIGTIIEWDSGRMVVINPGETDELNDTIAREKIDAGLAKPATAKASTNAPAPARTAKQSNPLTEARKRYKAAFGKGPSPRWGVEQIDEKIAEKASAAGAATDDAPPAA